MAATIDTVSFLEFLNPGCQQDKFFRNVARSLDPLLADIRKSIANNVTLAALDKQTEATLDFLAQYHFNIDVWDLSFSYAQKLALIKTAIVDKVHRGTRSAVEGTLSLAFNTASIVEWYEDVPVGIPYTFRILIADPLNDPAKISKMISLINRVKNARSYLASISSFISGPDSNMYLTPASAEYDYSVIM